MNRRRRLLLLRNIAWAIVILVLCAIPPGATPVPRAALIPHADKLVHLFLFLVMSFLLHGALRAWTRVGAARLIALVVLCCTAYGGAIELLQDHYLGRDGEWTDLLADATGAVAGSLARFALARGKRRKRATGNGGKRVYLPGDGDAPPPRHHK
ncbi:MAG: VanZ family protein [Odoribacteraceae bacterium]|jgi:VanZ family protein|nr:VanZ family protein [Odoribacteraceae bacterium]